MVLFTDSTLETDPKDQNVIKLVLFKFCATYEVGDLMRGENYVVIWKCT